MLTVQGINTLSISLTMGLIFIKFRFPEDILLPHFFLISTKEQPQIPPLEVLILGATEGRVGGFR